ncbi:MAG: hypothetical protein Q9227_001081 [Pyrenula ochraceoflavens]
MISRSSRSPASRAEQPDNSSNDKDLEMHAMYPSSHLTNDTVNAFAWRHVTVRVQDRATKQEKAILSDANGLVHAGEVLAIMGPSGCGKTTLLNVLAQRMSSIKGDVEGYVMINGEKTTYQTIRNVSCYVEQDDALIGSLTVKETIDFAAKLSLPRNLSKKARIDRINGLIEAFGLQEQAKTLIGTPIRKGISGGQKRRLSVASQLVTDPKVLFLDEPTSGLDSVAGYEVMSYIKQIAKRHRLIVIASIHQPSTSTYSLFDKLHLLSGGRTCYFGETSRVIWYLESIGHPLPLYTNPADFLLALVNIDFARDRSAAQSSLSQIQETWSSSTQLTTLLQQIGRPLPPSPNQTLHLSHQSHPNPFLLPLTLLHRSLLKSHRDIIAYGIRLAMYLGLAIMMGTVFLRLPTTQSAIQPAINALFFGSAFLSFMAVAYVPAFLEDRALYAKERANGLYGPTAFVVANFLIGVPYLFAIALLFSIVSYWLINFRPDPTAFFTYLLYLFLDLLAAESLVVLISSLLPIFVVALAVTAFANGLWMCVGGFLVPLGTLNVFWKYVFHYIDYQAYVFQGMMVNEFKDRNYSCARIEGGDGFQCMYPSDLQGQGLIRGSAVLREYGYGTGKMGEWVGILIAIIVVYRGLGWAALKWR